MSFKDEEVQRRLAEAQSKAEVISLAQVRKREERPSRLQAVLEDSQAHPVTKLAAYMRDAPELQGLFAYNDLTRQFVLTRPLPGLLADDAPTEATFPQPWTVHQVRLLTLYLRQKGLRPGHPDDVRALMTQEAQAHSFNPVQDYLNSLQWDGQSRLEHMFEHVLGLKNPAGMPAESRGESPIPLHYFAEIGRRFMVAAVARAFATLDKPYKFDWMPVLSGGQGIGKSRFGKILFGQWLREDLPANMSDKDAMNALQGCWGVELAELSSLKRSSQESAKSLLSREVDSFRAPYGSHTEDYPRRVSFLGTTNLDFYLTDSTGNRRFLPIPCTQPLNLEWLIANKDQLWAEAMTLWRTNPAFPTWIPDSLKEIIAELHKRYTTSDPLETKVAQILGEADQQTGLSEFRASTTWAGRHDFPGALLLEALGLPLSRRHEMRLGPILKGLGYENSQRRIGSRTTRTWLHKNRSAP
ncbi:hypothetical protein E3E12_00910 [Formicincola oecophyllae]|uniref:Virulence-associated protein E-like domain-containing protein n=1 Tax=Formicincola oecophyllae TaxID=2558361 RepID=A0A4Y6U6K9_9PROT|nr:virulence-associated E family protein [Formicincola oecophyllae]QDH12993.1 hypothetical protein E3E12_00910 [Formicincola oecophyllae]